MQHSNMTVKDICGIAIMAAITTVLAQIIVPMPAGVPISLQTFAIMLSGIILGPKYGAISSLIYLLMGIVGMPVFTGFRGGIQVFAGPTGGFLIAFPVLAYLSGMAIQHKKKSRVWMVFFLGLGLVVNYCLGVTFFCVIMDSSLFTAITACVLPFIPGDIIKTILAVIAGNKLRRRLEIALS